MPVPPVVITASARSRSQTSSKMARRRSGSSRRDAVRSERESGLREELAEPSASFVVRFGSRVAHRDGEDANVPAFRVAAVRVVPGGVPSC